MNGFLPNKELKSLDMEFFENLRRDDSSPVGELFSRLEQEIVEALDLYWSIAGEILEGSGIRLLDPPAEYRTLRRNFFSALFLFSYHRASILPERRVSYAAINHCLRGMVTGCDNILDSEYKPTLFTDVPTEATQFRSVLDIMVSDRVLFEILLRTRTRDGLPPGKVFKASAASLRALSWSGVQEASEEKGTDTILEPERILAEVHHYKTGLLFQCPWAVPLLVEPDEKGLQAFMLDALYWIGMGCQIMDDMVDFESDVERRRHNFIVSLIRHGVEEPESTRLQAIFGNNGRMQQAVDLRAAFPRALQSARSRAESFLYRGLESLLPVELHGIVPAVIETLASLIGARRLMERG
jgi:hypothetical protein